MWLLSEMIGVEDDEVFEALAEDGHSIGRYYVSSKDGFVWFVEPFPGFEDSRADDELVQELVSGRYEIRRVGE